MPAPGALGLSQRHKASQDVLATVYLGVVLVVINHFPLASRGARCHFVRQNYNSEGETGCQREVTPALVGARPNLR